MSMKLNNMACLHNYSYSGDTTVHFVFFPHFLIEGTIFGGKKKIKIKMCVSVFSTILSETFLILRRIQRDIITDVQRSSSKIFIMPVRCKSN